MNTLLAESRTTIRLAPGLGTPLPAGTSQTDLFWAETLVAAWCYPLLRSAAARALLLALVVGICATRAWIGLAGMQGFSHDAFMPLDGAWRLLNGQRPHLDFYSFIGILAYVPTAVGLRLSHGAVQGFAYGQALVGLLMGAWAYVLTRKRLADVPAALFTLAVVLLCTTPCALGYATFNISPAMAYNRYGYAVLGLILLEGLMPRTQRPSEFRGGFSSASLLVFLFFLKVTFFGAGVFLFGALGFCRRQTRRRLAGLAAGLLASVLPFCAYFEFHFVPMFRDFLMVAGGKHIRVRWYLFDSILGDAAVLLGLAAVVTAVLVEQRRGQAAKRFAIAAVAVCFASLLLILGNCEPHGLPLGVFIILIGASQVSLSRANAPQLMRAAALLWFTVLIGSAFAPSILGFGYGAFVRGTLARHAVPMSTTTLAGFVPVSDDTGYGGFVNDGIALLERHRRPADTVMSLDFTNPFSYGLGMKPAPGGTTALHYLTTFNDTHRPSAESLFGAAQLVMVPKTFSDISLQESIPRLYGPYLTAHFEQIGNSTLWRLYRARD